MAMTLRLPAALEAQAAAYAASLGLSFNNLVAVALREYLDARPTPAPQITPVEKALEDRQARRALAPSPAVVDSAPPAKPLAKLSPAERMMAKAQAKRAKGAS